MRLWLVAKNRCQIVYMTRLDWSDQIIGGMVRQGVVWTLVYVSFTIELRILSWCLLLDRCHKVAVYDQVLLLLVFLPKAWR